MVAKTFMFHNLRELCLSFATVWWCGDENTETLLKVLTQVLSSPTELTCRIIFKVEGAYIVWTLLPHLKCLCWQDGLFFSFQNVVVKQRRSIYVSCLVMTWDGSVRMDWVTRVWFLARTGIHFFATMIIPAWWQAPHVQWVLLAFSPELKQHVCGANHSPF
jgi:hypothetical protein